MVPSSSANRASSAKSAKKPATSPRFQASYIRPGMALIASTDGSMRSPFYDVYATILAGPGGGRLDCLCTAAGRQCRRVVAVRRLEEPAEMRRIGEPPARGYSCDRPVASRQVGAAPLQAAPADEG